MRVEIKKVSRKHWELRIDGKLAGTARSLEEMERQVRIMSMLDGLTNPKADL